jgi:RNA polymerase sigma-70 factor (ECF subfamily)
VTAEQERQAAGLMRRAQAGDRAAYAELLVQLAAAAGRFARGRAGSRPWIDDVVQETLITVDRVRHTYDPDRPFAPWFYAIASSRLVDVLRRERRIAARELGADVLPEAASAHDDGRTMVDAERIRAAVAALPPRHREVIENLKFRDESVRETAARLRMSEASVKITAHRGYKILRRMLGRDK